MNTTAVALDSRSLLQMSSEELDALYRGTSPGAIPVGDTRGTAILFAGSVLTRVLAAIASLFWGGKVFDAARGELRNKLSPFRFLAIRAKVYNDGSWLDGKPTIVIDYSKTSFVAGKIRDEIREIGPGLYLGRVWWGKRPIAHFALRA